MSAVQHKVVYDFKNARNENIVTIEEQDIEVRLKNKTLYRNIDDVRENLIASIEGAIQYTENIRKEFMKGKLKRVLHGEPREADTKTSTIKAKLENTGEKTKTQEDSLSNLLKDMNTLKNDKEFYEKMRRWTNSQMVQPSTDKMYNKMSEISNDWKKDNDEDLPF
jgi:glutaminase